MGKPSVSIFFPCYNDQQTIGLLVRRAHRLLKKLRYKHEVIIVDDGSSDASIKVLQRLRKNIPHMKLIIHTHNRGYGGALASGFHHARHDLVFYTDGDGQYDVGELELLLPLMTNDIDVVNGIKMERNDPFIRIVAGKAYNFFVRNLFGITIFDVDCDFRLIRRTFLKNIYLTTTSGAICVELVKKLQQKGARFREVTIHHYDRKYGTSQFFRPWKLLQTGLDVVRLWFSFYLS